MKDNNGYGLYYLIIVFLIIMIGIPPLLRVLLPKEDLGNTNNNKNTNTEEIEDKSEQKDNNVSTNGNSLTCNIMNPLEENKYLINIITEYKDDKVVLLKVMYDNILLQDNNSSQLDITKLKDIKGSSFDNTSNTITFDFNNDSIDREKLEQFLNKPNDQKKYYENLGFTCISK